MKKNYPLSALIALLLILAIPAVSHAQQNDGQNPSDGASIDANAALNVQVPPPSGMVPPPSNDNSAPSDGSAPGGTPGSIRDRIRADYQSRLQNLKDNEGYRNDLIEQHIGIATTTHADIQAMRAENKTWMGDASSTEATSTAERHALRMDAHLDIFKARVAGVVSQLNVSVENLTEIRGRIESRIQKEDQSGADMSAATALLAIADGKITLAQQAVADLAAYQPVATSTGDASAPSTPDLTAARALDTAAIQAIKDAQASLNDVVASIADALGVDLHAQATTTAQ